MLSACRPCTACIDGCGFCCCCALLRRTPPPRTPPRAYHTCSPPLPACRSQRARHAGHHCDRRQLAPPGETLSPSHLCYTRTLLQLASTLTVTSLPPTATPQPSFRITGNTAATHIRQQPGTRFPGEQTVRWRSDEFLLPAPQRFSPTFDSVSHCLCASSFLPRAALLSRH